MKFRKFLTAVAFFLGIVAAGSATAVSAGVDIPLGLVTSSTTFDIGRSGISGLFTDNWTFSLLKSDTGDTYTAAWVNPDIASPTKKGGRPTILSNITDFSTSLWNLDTQSLVSTTTNEYSEEVATLAGGNYSYKVTGKGLGTLGGDYSGYISVTPVPEPGEWAMMLAGLGLLGVIARRRTGI